MMLVLEAIGAVGGILGAVLMMERAAWSGYAYVPWLVSSIALMLFGIMGGYFYLALLNGVFMLANIRGVYKWLIRREPRDSLSREPAP
jgi:nicotinamide riboside transporter PnuC